MVVYNSKYHLTGSLTRELNDRSKEKVTPKRATTESDKIGAELRHNDAIVSKREDWNF